MIPAAVLLDLDGTLVDSERVYVEAYRRVLPAYGIHATDAELRSTIGVADEVVLPELMRRYGAEVELVELIARKNACFASLVAGEGLRVTPGTGELLDHAKAEGIVCLVVTSSARSMVELCLDRSGLAERLPMRICGDEVRRRKPDPEPYRIAAERLGVAPDRCLAVEDSVGGVTSARSAGCHVAAVLGSTVASRLSHAGADRIVLRLDELLPLDIPDRQRHAS